LPVEAGLGLRGPVLARPQRRVYQYGSVDPCLESIKIIPQGHWLISNATDI
jgi:hypothetical protein